MLHSRPSSHKHQILDPRLIDFAVHHYKLYTISFILQISTTQYLVGWLAFEEHLSAIAYKHTSIMVPIKTNGVLAPCPVWPETCPLHLLLIAHYLANTDSVVTPYEDDMAWQLRIQLKKIGRHLTRLAEELLDLRHTSCQYRQTHHLQSMESSNCCSAFCAALLNWLGPA